MPFSPAERAVLLAVKGVGPTVVRRLEEYGISDLRTLSGHQADALCAEISQRLGSTCWRNSPLARKALEGAIEVARMTIG
ncbi:MAG: helix-hairpin-helix domain-containing protein [Rhizobiales bacterium]|nr:helix-hairpin-helix domain-containing protein [Hyphomicrobiales bacterium]